MTQPPPPLTELKLPQTLKEAINTAFARFRPICVGYVSEDRRPELSFRGRGRVDNSEATRRVVYGGMHERERARDPEQKGVPLIIDLESVDGIFGDQVLQMRR